jgi:hypothetical protein
MQYFLNMSFTVCNLYVKIIRLKQPPVIYKMLSRNPTTFEYLKRRAMRNIINNIDSEIIDPQELGLNLYREVDQAINHLDEILTRLRNQSETSFVMTNRYMELYFRDFYANYLKFKFYGSFGYVYDTMRLEFVYCALLQKDGYLEYSLDGVDEEYKYSPNYIFCIDILGFLSKNDTTIKKMLTGFLGTPDLTNLIMSYVYSDNIYKFVETRRLQLC